MNRAVSLRSTLLLAALAVFVTLGLLGLALAARVVPDAQRIARRGSGTLDDYTARTELAAQLDSVLTDLWASLGQARRGTLPADVLEAKRKRLEAVIRRTSLLAPLKRTGEVTGEFSTELEQADRASQALSGALLGALSSLEVHDVPAAEALLRSADSLDTPLTARLSDVTRGALRDLATEEARLSRDARTATWLVGGVLLLMVVGAPLSWRMLRQRLFDPLASLDGALHRIDRGDLDAEVTVDRDDEIGRLAAHFNRTTMVLRSQRESGERAAAMAALEATEANYRAAFEQAAVGLAEIALDGRYLRINRAMTDVLGRPEAEIVGHAFSEFTHPEDRLRDEAVWPRLSQGQRISLEKRYVRGDGSIAVCAVTGSLLRTHDGAPRHVLTVVQDITEQRRLQHELLQSMKLDAVGQLAGGVAHDFNNLLAGVAGRAELLEHDAAHSPEVREDAAAIRRTALRGADLARSLLTLARRNPHRAEPFAFRPMIEETADLVRRTIDRRIAVELAMDGEATVLGDRSLVSNAILNLALNARDAMPAGGLLRLDAHVERPDPAARTRLGLAKDGPRLVLGVADTGSGMTAEVREHLFEPFFTTKAPGKGTGLGLAMVYGTVRDHGGAITVDSTLGEGTRFTLFLPCAADGTELGDAARAPVPADQARRILVVDDEDLVRDIAARMLRRLGYTVEVAVDGMAALDRLAREDHGIHLVILDGNMPRLNGAETARRLRARHPSLPLIYASGYFDPGLNDELDAIGFAEKLVKPYSMDAISRAVAGALGRSPDEHQPSVRRDPERTRRAE